MHRRWCLWALLVMNSALGAAPSLNFKFDDLASPAGPGAMGSSLVISTDGTPWVSWLEPAGTGEHAMKVARFDVSRTAWGKAITAARGRNWFVNWADFPVLAAQGEKLTAVWFVTAAGNDDHAYYAMFSVSPDAGQTWGIPQPITRESQAVEFVALQPLNDGRLLAAWLDARGRTGHHGLQKLYARVLGTESRDVLVDDSVCDCCQLSFTALGDTAWLAYRGRTSDEVRDMRIAEYRAGNWSAPRSLHADGWKIAACPVNGPQLAAESSRVAAVWFTAANNQSRVLAGVATGGLTTIVSPQRIDLGKPQGRVDTVLLRDGRALFTWLESSANEKEGGIYGRTLAANGELSAPALLAATTTARASGFPRIAALPGTGPSRVLVSYTRDGEPRQVATALLTLP